MCPDLSVLVTAPSREFTSCLVRLFSLDVRGGDTPGPRIQTPGVFSYPPHRSGRCSSIHLGGGAHVDSQHRDSNAGTPDDGHDGHLKDVSLVSTVVQVRPTRNDVHRRVHRLTCTNVKCVHRCPSLVHRGCPSLIHTDSKHPLSIVMSIVGGRVSAVERGQSGDRVEAVGLT